MAIFFFLEKTRKYILSYLDNPVVSTNNDYFLPSNTRPNDSLVSIVGVDQFGFNKSLDYDGHSTLLNIPLVPKVTAAVFPAEAPKEDCYIRHML